MRDHAREIWQAGVNAVRPGPLIKSALAEPRLRAELAQAQRIVVLGAGKAGSAMAQAVEQALAAHGDRVVGLVNVPADTLLPTQRIELCAARPAGVNFPTAAGVVGARRMLGLASSAQPGDLALCLLSGGGSALLPLPAAELSLEDKLHATQLLHRAGATIQQMNAVRKHLSGIKGGWLAQTFTGKCLVSLIISDVIGDPLDVIASGPTAPDSTTYADACEVIERLHLREAMPVAVWKYLEEGRAGHHRETPKQLGGHVRNHILANNAQALAAAQAEARQRGFVVQAWGSAIAGDTTAIAREHADRVRNIVTRRAAGDAPLCLLSGGETTVTLGCNPGQGGRNQEYVLAFFDHLGPSQGVTVLSGGTDGEDGPTDAAGALADAEIMQRVVDQGLNVKDHLARHDAYPLWAAVGGLLKTGPTQTNVMDLRVILVA